MNKLKSNQSTESYDGLKSLSTGTLNCHFVTFAEPADCTFGDLEQVCSMTSMIFVSVTTFSS